MLRSKKGQNVLEYVIILTVIIAAIILASKAYLKPSVEKSVKHVSDQMEKQVEKIDFGK